MKLDSSEIAKDFQNYSFFANFGDDLVLQIAQLAELKSYNPGEQILKKDQNNENLYFLKSGKVKIILDGEKIHETSTPGDVLGEMSVISRIQVSADVVVSEPTQVYCISTQNLSHLSAQDLNEIQYLIYRVYCVILTHRLRVTNEKARQFEIANRDLQAAQEELRSLSLKKMNDLDKARQFAFDKIENLSQDILEKLNLDELVEIYKKEKSIHNKKVLLIDSNKKQHLLAKMAFGGSGVQLDLAFEAADLTKYENKQYDMIIFDSQSSEVFDLILKKYPLVPCAMITDADVKQTIEVIKKFPQIQFFISRDLEDRAATLKFYSTTATKILSKDIFGMEKYLSWGVEKKEKIISTSQNRQVIIEEMIQHFKAMGIRSQILDRLRISTEEMLMNAIYDAPVDEQGKPLFNHLPRTEVVNLKPNQCAMLTYSCDGIWLAVSVTDHFGGLKKDIITNYLESCYKGEAGSLNANKGGAGRGLHMLIESSDLTVFNIERGKRTEVISMINLENVAMKRETTPTFHFFKIS